MTTIVNYVFGALALGLGLAFVICIAGMVVCLIGVAIGIWVEMLKGDR